MTPENDERLMSVVYSSRAREAFDDEALRNLPAVGHAVELERDLAVPV